MKLLTRLSFSILQAKVAICLCCGIAMLLALATSHYFNVPDDRLLGNERARTIFAVVFLGLALANRKR